MYKKASIGLAIVLAMMYFFAGMIFYQFLKPDITIMRSAAEMNCDAPDTSGDMLVCLLGDIIIPYFIIGVLATVGGIITNEAFK